MINGGNISRSDGGSVSLAHTQHLLQKVREEGKTEVAPLFQDIRILHFRFGVAEFASRPIIPRGLQQLAIKFNAKKKKFPLTATH